MPTLYWTATDTPPVFDPESIARVLGEPRMEHRIVQHRDVPTLGIATGGEILVDALRTDTGVLPLVALLPPAYPEWLGDRSFHEAHGVRFAYVGGEMARGIASADLVIALARSGMLGFFGAAGLSLETIESNLARLDAVLTQENLSWGANLIHTTDAPELEEHTVDLMLKHSVRRMSASAFMKLSPAVVRYASRGLRRDAQGQIERTNHVFAKISRPEVARHFLEPPPRELLQQLVDNGQITPDEATLAALLPIAEDVTIEADSGGHTDNRPLTALFPAIATQRDELAAKHRYPRPIRLGAAGGLGTPAAVAGAFALGAAYVLIGSVHQSTLEAGLSVDAKRMLADAGIADVAMTAAADMFEAGVKVQVLKRGTLMAPRGNKLHQLFRQHESLDALPATDRAQLERDLFRQSLDDVWRETEAFFREREPAQLERAAREPKHRMALVFRWYLGQSSRWPIAGTTERRSDYQIWCGPAMGAFNAWAKGSYLEPLENRSVQQIALNLMEGAAVLTRVHHVRSLGVPVASSAFVYLPKPLAL